MLCVCSFRALPFGSGSEQQDGTGREERVTRELLPGLEVTGSQGGPSSLRSPQTFRLHLAQDITSLGKLRAPARGAEPATRAFPSREVPGSSLALHMGKAFGAQRCLVPAAKPSPHGGLYPVASWACSQLGSHISLCLCPPFSSPQAPTVPFVIPYPPPPFHQPSLEKVTGALSSHPGSSQALCSFL